MNLLKQGVSIIVCCYNSESTIERTIDALIKQKTNFKYEILLIDNLCTDNSIVIAKKKLSKSGCSYKILIEDTPGLTNARKRGVFNARYNILVFCDDDNFLSENYIQIVFEEFSNNKTIGAIGGKGIAISSINLPEWFEKYRSSFACGPQGENGDVTKSRGYLYGAALGVRTELIRNIFLSTKLVLSDRKGNKLLSGGDSEITVKIALEGHKLFYFENLTFQHYLHNQRLNLKYLEKLHLSFGKSQIVLYPLIQKCTIGKEVKINFRYTLKLFCSEYRNIFSFLSKKKSFSGTIKGAFAWGIILGFIRQKVILFTSNRV
ncbi:MAG: glycosyltransferase family 2 protein [Bacteroidetes bacterium]|nr:glycosyltransferase family 2 protein [Bacteroidota bacterium]